MEISILITAAAVVAGFVIGFILGALLLKVRAERKLGRIGQAMGTMGAAQLWPRALNLAKKL